MNNISIGEKIKNFRKRAGMSQLELEIELGAANGSISRVEAGKVNPTKETILQLAKTLNLSDKELADLLGVKPLLPTTEEIQDAIAECKSYLDREDVIAYLLDENGILYYASQGFKNIMSLTEEQVNRIQGTEVLKVILDPSYGVAKFLDFEKNKKILAIEIARISRESNIADEYVREFLVQLPLATEVVALAQTVTPEDILSTINKRAYFKLGAGEVIMTYARERLKGNHRFEIIEFNH